MSYLSKSIPVGLVMLLLSGCTFQMQTTRNEIATSTLAGREVSVTINDENLGGGEQAYVNASVVAQIKAGAPGVTLVAGGENLSINVELLSATFMQRWYTIVTFGALKLYYQLGSVRVVDRDSGKILAVHEVLLSGRRVRPLGLIDYQQIVLPEVVKLVNAEMQTQGIASGAPLRIDVSEDLVALD